jgi:peptidoglycan/LPS O-acetylase OafA/YrhL
VRRKSSGNEAQLSSWWTTFRGTKVFGSLDGLRAISIIGVIWHHATRGRHLPFAEQGSMGVQFFFAISGFLITTLLLRERARTGRISLKNFYARRSLRIFPLYYTVVLLYVAIVLMFEWRSPDGREFFHNLRYFATYTSNWFVALDGRVIFYFAWSLATEEQFYLAWPSAEKFLPRHWPVAVPLGVLGLWTLVRGDHLPLEIGSLARVVILSVAPSICMGVILAHALHSRTGFGWIAPILGRRWMSTALLAVVIGLLAAESEPLLVFLAMTLLVGSCVVHEEHALAPLLKLGPMVSIGQTSYGIYLLHMLVLNAVEKSLRWFGVSAVSVVFPVTVLGVWGTAWTSYRYYESRFLKLKDRFAS